MERAAFKCIVLAALLAAGMQYPSKAGGDEQFFPTQLECSDEGLLARLESQNSVGVREIVEVAYVNGQPGTITLSLATPRSDTLEELMSARVDAADGEDRDAAAHAMKELRPFFDVCAEQDSIMRERLWSRLKRTPR